MYVVLPADLVHVAAARRTHLWKAANGYQSRSSGRYQSYESPTPYVRLISELQR